MIRLGSFLIALTIVVLGLLAKADEDSLKEPIEKNLLDAVQEFKKANEVARTLLLEALNRKESVAQRAGDLQTVQAIQSDRKGFEEKNELPKSVPLNSYSVQLRRAQTRLEAAYELAIKQHTKKGNLKSATTAQQELDRFRSDHSHPLDAIAFKGKFYKVSEASLSWHAAKAECERQGGLLAVATTAEENDFLLTLLEKANIPGAWLGATDEIREGEWVWVTSAKMTFSNWGTWSPNDREPNNFKGGEHYLVLVREMAGNSGWRGKWSDQKADADYRFICMWGDTSSQTSTISNDNDNLGKKLSKNRNANLKLHATIREEILQQIDQKVATERLQKIPNLKFIETWTADRERLDKSNVLPLWIDISLQRRLAKAHGTFIESLREAKAEYVRTGRDESARSIEMEIETVEQDIRAFRSRFDTANFVRENVVYQIINHESGLALDVIDASKFSGAKLIQREPSANTSQRWKLRAVNSRFQIVNQNSSHVINIPYGSDKSGIELIQFENGGGKKNEVWSISQQGRGFVFLSTSNLVLAIPEGVKREGSSILQSKPNNKDCEVWLLVPLD